MFYNIEKVWIVEKKMIHKKIVPYKTAHNLKLSKL